MGKNYRKELQEFLREVIEGAIDGEKLATINSLLWLANRLDGLPENSGAVINVEKRGINFKIEITRRKK